MRQLSGHFSPGSPGQPPQFRSPSASFSPASKEGIFSVDRSKLFSPTPLESTLTNPCKEPATPLAKDLLSLIELRGAISIHDYMAFALHHSQHGYYRSLEEIGAGGDFVTSPEVSQLFGEVLGLWAYSLYKALGSPKVIHLVEMGPGKGTLMGDMLRVLHTLGSADMVPALRVHMIEASPSLSKVQADTLSRYSTSISWHSYLSQLPPMEGPVLVIGQEFLDAFPVHQFVFTKDGWREKLIDIDHSDSAFHFRVVLANKETPAVRTLLLSPAARAQSISVPASPAIGDQLEVCPMALSVCSTVSKLIHDHNGAALFIDYGQESCEEDSIRAFQKHTQVPFLSCPGQVDMTADVDFAALRRAVSAVQGLSSLYSTQGQFLMAMGIVDRVMQLIDQDEVSEDEAQAIVDAMKMLVEGEKMGEKFKVLGIVRDALVVDVPGFSANSSNCESAADWKGAGNDD